MGLLSDDESGREDSGCRECGMLFEEHQSAKNSNLEEKSETECTL